MKKILVLFLFAITLATTAWGQAANQLKLRNFKDISVGGFNLSSAVTEWVNDADGNPCALVRVKFVNMSDAAARSLDAKFNRNSITLRKKEDKLAESKEMYYYIVATSSKPGQGSPVGMSVVSQTYGESNVLNVELVEGWTYECTVENSATVTVTVDTKVPGTRCVIRGLSLSGEDYNTDLGDYSSDGRISIANVPMGNHEFEVSKDGKVLKTATFEISETQHSLVLDSRPTKMLKIKSSEGRADVYVNDTKQGTTDLSLTLPYDNYKISVQLDDERKDVRQLEINADTPDEIVFNPVKRMTYKLMAMSSRTGNPMLATCYRNNVEMSKDMQEVYEENEPYGERIHYRMVASNGGEAAKWVKVSKEMPPVIEFKIKDRHNYVSNFEKYEPAPFGVTAGFVQKSTYIHGYGAKDKMRYTDFKDKSLYGMQFGFHANPTLRWGLGFYTGILADFYLQGSTDGFGDGDKYKTFMELDLSVPLHGHYSLPLGEKAALGIQGGISLGYVCTAGYSGDDVDEVQINDFWSDGGNDIDIINPFFVTYDFGVHFRANKVQVRFMYSKSLTDPFSKDIIRAMDFDTDEVSGYMKKWTLSVSYVF